MSTANAGHSLSPIRIVRTVDEAVALSEELLEEGEPSCYDTEWYNFDNSRHPVNNALVFCSTHAWRRKRDNALQRVYVHNFGEQDGLIHQLTPWFSSQRTKIAHNAPVDVHSVENHGIRVMGELWDTMVMDWMLDATRARGEPYFGPGHDLKSCAHDFLGRPERDDFDHMFGMPKLKLDGTPYANMQLIVPTLPEYISQPGEGGTTVTNPPLYTEAVHGAAHERRRLAERLQRELTVTERRHAGPYSRWLTLYDYAVADAWDGYELYEHHRKGLERLPWRGPHNYWYFFTETEAACTRLIAGMERLGMCMDAATMQEMLTVAQAEVEELEAQIVAWAGAPIKVTSDKQLRMLLHGEGQQPVMWKTSKKRVDFYITGRNFPVSSLTEKQQLPQVGASQIKVLLATVKEYPHLSGTAEQHAADIAGLKALLRFSTASWHMGNMQKFLSILDHGRVRGRINQIGTSSGRWSTSDPANLQNVATGEKDLYHMRDCFAAPPGYLLLVADFSQLEYRLLAHFTQEPKLIRLFEEGWDLHSLTAYNVFPEIRAAVNMKFGEFTLEASHWIKEEYDDLRKKAKTLNFEIIYGVGHVKLSEQLEIPEHEGKRMIDGWFEGYPHVKRWQKNELAKAAQFGFGKTLAGRYRRVKMERFLSSDRSRRGEEERSFLNALIQGSAADMTKKSMILISRSEELRELGLRMTMQVHDEIVMEIPARNAKAAVPLVRKIMEQPFSQPLRVPMPVSIGVGPTWASAKV